MRGGRIPGDSCGKTGDPRPRSVGFHEGGSGVRPRKASGIRPHELHKKSLQKNTGFLYKLRQGLLSFFLR
ncbi:hypothetical protein AAV35_008240 [Salimicrobium jeotgali]|uniref:Uncharacterized protein n=1 Tax=Salimicrobium jeotgali TaxID=1230341 RepID=A0AAC8PRZ0_9BACI|nr:hypothetical protein AAV35_008240 [Salimicrobium jeotgali]